MGQSRWEDQGDLSWRKHHLGVIWSIHCFWLLLFVHCRASIPSYSYCSHPIWTANCLQNTFQMAKAYLDLKRCKSFQLHFLRIAPLLPPYSRRPWLHFGVMHSFDGNVCQVKAAWSHFLLVSINQNDQTNRHFVTLFFFFQSWSAMFSWKKMEIRVKDNNTVSSYTESIGQHSVGRRWRKIETPLQQTPLLFGIVQQKVRKP